MIAPKTRTHPSSSLEDKDSCKMTAPANAANTDSKERIIPAMEASASFCPTICKVYPAPLERIPEYKIGTAASMIFCMDGCSRTNIGIKHNSPAVKN